MPTVGPRELAFINHGDKIVAILREAYYSIEDQPITGEWGEHGDLYEVDEETRGLLRDAGHELYWRSKGLFQDERRNRMREAISHAVTIILAWQPDRYNMGSEAERYRDQETIWTASTLIVEAQGDIIREASRAEAGDNLPKTAGSVAAESLRPIARAIKKRRTPLKCLRDAQEILAARLLGERDYTCRDLAGKMGCSPSAVTRLKAWKNRALVGHDKRRGYKQKLKDESLSIEAIDD
jgi:hypothetical protein